MSFIDQAKASGFPLKFILSRILLRTGLCRIFTVQRSGYKIRFNPSGISAQLWVDSSRMRWEEQFLEDYLKPGDTFIDVGANIGTLSLRASKLVGDNGLIFSFEANPDLASFIEDNMQLNDFHNIKVYNQAVGEKMGIVTFALNKSDDRSRISDKEKNSVEVKLCKLDEIIPSDLNVSLLKVDTEGYEKFVFQGAEETIKRSKVIMFESIEENTNNYNYSTDENIIFLEKQGFKILKLGRNKIMYSIKPEKYLTYAGDLFAISDIDNFVKRTNYTIQSNN